MKDELPRIKRIERILQFTDSIFKQLLPTVPRELLELDLTMTQLKVVLLLFLNGPVRVSALALELGVSLPTTTGVIDRLVERGIVMREEPAEDRRVVLCRLSEQGHSLVSGMWTYTRNRARELLKGVPFLQLVLIEKTLKELTRTRATSPGVQDVVGTEETKQ